MSEALFIGAAVVSFANGLALLLVNPRRMINRVFFGGTILTCVWFFCILMAIRAGNAPPPDVPNRELEFWVRMCSTLPALILWQIAVMRILLWEEISDFTHLMKKAWPWSVISLALAALTLSESYIPAHSTRLNPVRGPGYWLFMAACVGAALWTVVDSLRRTPRLSGVRRLEAQFFLFNSSAASLLVILCSIGGHFLPEYAWLRRLGPIWICLWHGLTVWSICYHRIFDARHVVLSLGQRLLLLGFLGMIAAGLAGILRNLLGLWPSIMLASIATGGLGLVCDRPMRRWFGLDPVHLLARPRETVLEWARQAPGEETLRVRFEGLLREWGQTDRAALLPLSDVGYAHSEINLSRDWAGFPALNRDGWTTPESLQRRRESAGTKACQEFLDQHHLGALLAVHQGSQGPSLLVALGERTSLRPYTFPDMQLLRELTELMDNILTHSRMSAHDARLKRMESAAMMSRGLAHDLNNLATPVASFLLHMESRVRPGTTESEVLHDAKHAVRVMQDYIRESLFFTRQLVPDFRLQSSTTLLASTVKVTQNRAKAREVKVVIAQTAELLFHADGALLQRLLQNLVFNGIDATPPGGQVTLSVTASGPDCILFNVTDQGSGVSTDIIDRIFEPYFTTKDTGNENRGFGLGLAISLKIGSLHGGTIRVGRATSGGAVFTVLLPLNPKPPA